MSWRLERGANVGADGAVTFTVWAPRRRALSVRMLDAAGGDARRAGDDARRGRRVHGARGGGGRARRAATTSSCCPTSARARIRCRATSRTASTRRRASSRPTRLPGPTPAGAASPRADLVVYELHVGTFSPEGTFDGVAARLPYLRDLGVTAVELMPVAAFPGDRNWGYDGVYLFAPHTAYGGPDGPEAARRRVPRPRARADPRRRLQPPRAGGELPRRLRPVLHRPLPHAVGRRAELRRPRQRRGAAVLRRQRAALAHRVPRRRAAPRRDPGHPRLLGAADPAGDRRRVPRRGRARWAGDAWLIAESDLNDPRVIRPKEVGGLGLDAQWSDDFHHALHAIVTGNRRGYFGDFGRVADVSKAITAGFVYDGQHAPHRRRRHGAPRRATPAIASCRSSRITIRSRTRTRGKRLAQVAGPARQKVAATVLFSTPALPLLFQGEE